MNHTRQGQQKTEQEAAVEGGMGGVTEPGVGITVGMWWACVEYVMHSAHRTLRLAARELIA